MAGVIGFVGLAAPHLVRGAVSDDPARTLAPSAIAGAILLTVADLLARVIPSEDGSCVAGRGHGPVRRPAVRPGRLARRPKLARMTAALELLGLTVRRGARTILSDISLSVAPGELLGVVGPNGAGKTTLLRAALGLQLFSAGDVRLGGRALASIGERERAAIAGYLPQERRVAWNMPARDIAALGANALAPRQSLAIAEACLAELEVKAAWLGAACSICPAGSGPGCCWRVCWRRAPDSSLPTNSAAGLDPEAQLLILERLRRRADDGAAVIVTSHDLTLAARACDRLAVMHEGRLRALAPPLEALSPQVLAEVFALDGALIETGAGLTLAAGRTAQRGAD